MIDTLFVYKTKWDTKPFDTVVFMPTEERERESEMFREEKMRKMIVVALAFISFYREGAEDAAF